MEWRWRCSSGLLLNRSSGCQSGKRIRLQIASSAGTPVIHYSRFPADCRRSRGASPTRIASLQRSLLNCTTRSRVVARNSSDRVRTVSNDNTRFRLGEEFYTISRRSVFDHVSYIYIYFLLDSFSSFFYLSEKLTSIQHRLLGFSVSREKKLRGENYYIGSFEKLDERIRV